MGHSQSAPTAGPPTPGPSVWVWQNDHASFNSYDPSASKILEDAIQAGKPSAQLKFGSSVYVVNFATMTQVNSRTGFSRPIRRVSAATLGMSAASLVPGWYWLDDSGWKPFDAAASAVLEAARTGAQPTSTLTIAGKAYLVDLKAMTQTNTVTGFSRNICFVNAGAASIAAGTAAATTPTAAAAPAPSGRSLGVVYREECDPSTGGTVGAATPETVAALTGWTHPASFEELAGRSCSVCICDYEEDEDDLNDIVKLGQCRGHYFHADCIVQCFKHSVKCPICSTPYAAMIGHMPKGTMTVTRYPPGRYPLAGHEREGTIIIKYVFPSGIQNDDDPNPGVPYEGTSRTGFLPDTDAGNEVMELLVRAFKNRQTFVVGTSVTTGRSNCVVWNGIHHKTNVRGGPTRFGYPDETYFERVKAELAMIGITPPEPADSGSDSDGDASMSSGSTGAPMAGAGGAGSGAAAAPSAATTPLVNGKKTTGAGGQ